MRKISLLLLGVCALSTCSHKKSPQLTWSQLHRKVHESIGKKYAIASPGFETGKVAKLILDQGGNLVDAAVAASFAVSVERPQSTGLGGGGFMLMKFANSPKLLAIDFRERAPLRATENMYLDAQKNVVAGLSTNGVKAAAVPGLVAGLIEIHAKYGKLPLEKIMQPAIDLAEKGFKVYPHLAEALHERRDILVQDSSTKVIFLKEEGSPYVEGELLIQRDLAKTLRAISQYGKKGFYEGWVAQALLDQQKKLGGLITPEDLKNYEVKYREPLMGTYKGYDIYSMPPPSSGGVHLIQILNLLEETLPKSVNAQSTEAIDLTSRSMQVAFRDRAKYLGDPDFVKVPTKELISAKYAIQMKRELEKSSSRQSKDVPSVNLWAESDQTTHISLIDAEGNAIATTQTINGYMGAGVVVPGTGVLLNNEMDDFSVKPGVANMFGALGGKENAIAPQKTPLSSMAPTIVMKQGRPIFAVGSPGGTRIISCVLMTLLNYFQYGQDLYTAVAAPRYHHQWSPDEIRFEQKPDSKTEKELIKLGYKLNVSPYKCSIQVVSVEKGDTLHAVSDPRDIGLAITGF